MSRGAQVAAATKISAVDRMVQPAKGTALPLPRIVRTSAATDEAAAAIAALAATTPHRTAKETRERSAEAGRTARPQGRTATEAARAWVRPTAAVVVARDLRRRLAAEEAVAGLRLKAAEDTGDPNQRQSASRGDRL